MRAITTEGRRQTRLRVGIVLGGRLVEERVLPPGHDVTLGTSPRTTCMVPSQALPRRWSLFRWRRGGWQLCRHPAMDGRLAADDSLVALPRARLVPLRQGVRGKVSVADVTVLFQLVRWPELARPRLPASIRGSVLGMVDRSFAAVLAVCFLFHLAFVLQLRRIDWPRSVEHLADDFQQVFVRQRPPGKATVAIPPATTKPGQAPSQRTHVTSRPAPRPQGERRADLIAAVHRAGLLAVIGNRSTDASSAVADLLGNGAVARAQEEALAGVNSVQLASTNDRLGIRVGGGSGTVVDVHGLSNDGARIAAADTGQRNERNVPHVNSGQPFIEAGSTGHLDPGQLAREVRGRLGALRACYERSLKRNPNLGGKVVLHLTITAAGTVSAVDLTSESLDDPDLASCVRSSVMRWRFPAPEGGGLEVSFPFVFQAAS
jgi:hypothetical protein